MWNKWWSNGEIMGYTTLSKDIIFTDLNGVIHAPLKIESEEFSDGSKIFNIHNLGTKALEHIGGFFRPSSNMGPWDNPADFPPATDYQDLLTWGTATAATAESGSPLRGGIKLTIPADSEESIYITRKTGAQWNNRIKFGNLGAGQTLSVKIEFEVPDAIDSRRLFVDFVVG